MTFIISEKVHPTLTLGRVLAHAWDDKGASMKTDDLYRLLNVRMTLVCDDERQRTLVVEDVWALGVIGESNRFTLPLLSDFGPEHDRYDTLALEEGGGGPERWRRGWSSFGLEIPGRQSFHIATSWTPAFLARFGDIRGPKHVDVHAVFEQIR